MLEKTLTKEERINISTALATQEGLVNEIYPGMRSVRIFVNHLDKCITVLFVFVDEYIDDYKSSIESVDSSVSSEIENDYKVQIKHTCIPKLKWFEVVQDNQSYSIIAYQEHQSFEYDKVEIIKVDLNKLSEYWDE